jgi:hypothetical protein
LRNFHLAHQSWLGRRGCVKRLLKPRQQNKHIYKNGTTSPWHYQNSV